MSSAIVPADIQQRLKKFADQVGDYEQTASRSESIIRSEVRATLEMGLDVEIRIEELRSMAERFRDEWLQAGQRLDLIAENPLVENGNGDFDLLRGNLKMCLDRSDEGASSSRVVPSGGLSLPIREKDSPQAAMIAKRNEHYARIVDVYNTQYVSMLSYSLVGGLTVAALSCFYHNGAFAGLGFLIGSLGTAFVGSRLMVSVRTHPR